MNIAPVTLPRRCALVIAIGALCVGSPAQNQFAVESADMLTKLANVAAIALENARLFAQAERVATLEERRRVAAEMHDGLGQTLSYLGLMTDQVVEFLSDGKETSALQRLHKTRETISKATSDVRRAINKLMDDTPVSKDLCTRLHDTLDEIAHNMTWNRSGVLTRTLRLIALRKLPSRFTTSRARR
ncbi:MAG: hypothetical protein IPL71_03955 [Anaerolineales bacterium]|uniref:histidine kinase n=1 Tax=Candidatus Villigracilis proximus TaxID=3140683 RepID=UPI003134DA30|nr:hypothetical protein [Anaerolineales bacterium]